MKIENNYKQRLHDLNIVIILPTYNNDTSISKVIEDVSEYSDNIIVVNDGSTDATSSILANFTNIDIISYSENKGKGIALRRGFKRALERGFRYAITLDTDGQHYASDILKFVDKIEAKPDSLLIGSRDLSAENMPNKNSFANRFSNFWYKIETGVTLEDTQSGFRLYPLEKIKDFKYLSSKYEFELEVMVYAAWKDINVENITVNVYYPKSNERITHFRPFRDFARISVLNTYLVNLAILWYWPKTIVKACTVKNIKAFVRERIINAKESNKALVFAVMLGSLFGLLPIWGYQMIAAGFAAHTLKLNKTITIIAANISLPPIIPFILYASFYVGGIVLNKSLALNFSDISFESVKINIVQYLVGSFVLALVYSLFMGALSFLLLKIFRRNK